MKKLLYLLLLLIGLIACGPAPEPAAQSAPAAEATGALQESPTAPTEVADEQIADEQERESEEPTPTVAATEEPPSTRTEADEAEVPEVPALSLGDPNVVRDRDYVLGTSDPLVTIIEYGDFQ